MQSSATVDSRKFLVSGLRFSKDEAATYAQQHFHHFGDHEIKFVDATPSTSSDPSGFIKTEEPIQEASGSEHRGYAVLTFATEEAANACANFSGKHELKCGYEVNVQRLSDRTKGLVNYRVPTNRVMITAPKAPHAVITDEVLYSTFSPFGELAKIELPSRKKWRPQCWFLEFMDPAAVERVVMQNHCVAGHRVRIRRVLRSEDIKKEAQKDRERQHRQQWIEQQRWSDPAAYRRAEKQRYEDFFVPYQPPPPPPPAHPVAADSSSSSLSSAAGYGYYNSSAGANLDAASTHGHTNYSYGYGSGAGSHGNSSRDATDIPGYGYQ